MNEINEITLTTPRDELEQKLLSESSVEEVKNIIDLFNLNIKKKDAIRNSKLSELQDKISEQMQERIEKNADAFSNKDLLDYFKTIQETLKNSSVSSDDLKVPVQIAQQQINVNIQEQTLDRESKNKVLAAIRSILNKEQSPAIEAAVLNIKEESEEPNIEFRIKDE